MINFISQPFDVESSYSCEEIARRVDSAIETQKNSELHKQKGQPLFIFSCNMNVVRLKYYQSYKNDMCDTMYQGELRKGLDGCQLIGGIKKPRAVWGICIAIACSLLIDLLIISFLIVFSENFELIDHLLEWLLVIAIRAVIIVQLLRFDRKRVKLVKDKIVEFMQSPSGSTENEE